MSDEDFKQAMLAHAKETREFQQKVTTALFGDAQSEIPGLAKRVKNVEGYVASDKKFKAKVAGALVILTPILAMLGDWIKRKLGF